MRRALPKDVAHGGDAFYPDPGSPWIKKKTCGQCHPEEWRKTTLMERVHCHLLVIGLTYERVPDIPLTQQY